jgi:hypothetical protein
MFSYNLMHYFYSLYEMYTLYAYKFVIKEVGLLISLVWLPPE